ncbi:MAG: T9SS type A sorting domain-containing protein [Bacteroidota bacterium]
MKKSAFQLCLFSLILLTVSKSLIAQKEINERTLRMGMHNEVPADAYHPSQEGNQLSSPAYTRETSLFFTTQVNIDADGNNILNDAANEPSIAIDPLNPDRMAIGWRQFDNVNNNFRQAGYAYTSDGGQVWNFPGVIDPGVFRSDPVLEADNQGVFYYNSLTSSGGNYFCRVYRSNDGGAQWDEGIPAQGGDKQWMEIDKSGGAGEGNIYSFWTSYYSICYPGNFTRSTNGGSYYEDCVSVNGDPYWGTLAIGPESELYIVGAGFNDGLVVAKSSTAWNPDALVEWDYFTEVFLNGIMIAGPAVNPVGLLGQASIAVNHAPGPGYGNVYVLASVEGLNNGDPGDVMFAKSEDGGLSFGTPVRINDDLSVSNTQWFGTMSVAPNGRIDVVWLDTRDAPAFAPLYSSLYYSYSLDRGETWSDNELLSESFDPHLGWPNQEKMGDYFDMVSDNGNAHLAWANTMNGEQDVYYGRITPVITGSSQMESDNPLETMNISPNPFNENSRISFRLSKPCVSRVVLCDISGREIRTLDHSFRNAGSHSILVAGPALENGIYFCRITAGGVSKTLKFVRVE